MNIKQRRELVKTLVKAGFSDRSIADHLRMSPSSIFYDRKALKIDPGYGLAVGTVDDFLRRTDPSAKLWALAFFGKRG